MIQIRDNNLLYYLVTIKYGWRYDNEIVITTRTLFFVHEKYQIYTLELISKLFKKIKL